MANFPSDPQAARRRASFARAERLRREREAGQDRTKQARARTGKRNPAKPPSRSADVKASLREREKRLLEIAKTPVERQRVKTMFANLHRAVNRDDEFRAQWEKHKQQRAAEKTRNDQRLDQDKRQQVAKEATKRAHDGRRQDQQRLDQRRREEVRKASNRRAADQKQQERKATELKRQQMLKVVADKARAAVEQDQKRRQADQQAAARRQTDELRNRHRTQRDSFRTNESIAMERHLGAVHRLDAAERRELDQFEIRRASLTGRLSSLVPGSRGKADEQRQEIRDRYEKERMTKHRDLEAFKERQFNNEQATRIKQAKERLDMMQTHRVERDQFQQKQAAERPRLIEQRQQTLVAVQERQQSQERQQTQDRQPAQARQPNREADHFQPQHRAAPEFQRVR